MSSPGRWPQIRRGALRWTKRLIREDLQLSLPTMLQMSAAFQDMAHHTDDHREAVAAFIAQRAPSFRGS